jgi:hypothetical protein
MYFFRAYQGSTGGAPATGCVAAATLTQLRSKQGLPAPSACAIVPALHKQVPVSFCVPRQVPFTFGHVHLISPSVAQRWYRVNSKP